jgi:hypothetical protein
MLVSFADFRLKACFDTISAVVPGPLQPMSIIHILRQFLGPLHQKWLGYVAVSVNFKRDEGEGYGYYAEDFDPTLLMHDWGFSSWEDLANFPTTFGFAGLPSLPEPSAA